MPFTTAYRIRFDDVDGAGVLYYPRYFHLCHQALEDSFDSDAAPLSYPDLIRDRRLGVPTVALEGSFTAPLAYGDTALVTMRVESVGNSSLVLGFTIHRKAGAVECFSARITTVLTDLDTWESTPFPDDLRGFFEGWRVGTDKRP